MSPDGRNYPSLGGGHKAPSVPPGPPPEPQGASPPPACTSVNGAPIDVGPQINIQTDGAEGVNIDVEDATRGEERRITVVFTHGLERKGPLRIEMPPEHAREVARLIVSRLGLHECLADWGPADAPLTLWWWFQRTVLRRKEP